MGRKPTGRQSLVVGPIEPLLRSEEHLSFAAGDLAVTVAVCFADGQETLRQTVASLHEQREAPPFELLLVTNGTTDDSVEVAVEAARGLPVRVVRCLSVGYDANARNVAMSEAAAEKIVFLDADDQADPGYVAAMSRALDRSTVVTASWELERLNAPASTPRATELLPFHHQGWTYAPAGTLGLRRSVADQIGGFDPALSYAANNEWCWRAYAAGHPVEPAPGALVSYRLRASVRGTFVQRYRWGLWEVAAIVRAMSYGLPRVTLRDSVGRLWHVLADVPRLRTTDGRIHAARDIGSALGRLVGSVRFGTFAL